jgi:hypothetical protein
MPRLIGNTEATTNMTSSTTSEKISMVMSRLPAL